MGSICMVNNASYPSVLRITHATIIIAKQLQDRLLEMVTGSIFGPTTHNANQQSTKT